ncbi:hypothetical protein [Kitasatospora cheerisanensis]|uniref:hypothetical protein n=1 Tax=Kitasatospora cheerisanensis TaxID=81942 RepID=UPI0012ED5C42|nr:hypothetical protein [Kitasatospora cheerisanensis]
MGADGDFGISGLGMKINGAFGPADRTAALDFVTTRLERRGPWEAAALSSDASRLIASTLSNPELEILWLSTTGRRFDAEWGPGSIRDLLTDIVAFSSKFLRKGDADAFLAQSSLTDSPEIRQLILEEIDTVQESLVGRCDPSVRDRIIPLLNKTVGEIGSDLGMRLFLRAMKTSFAPIGLTRLARLEALGERIGYSDLVVADGTLNTHFDLTD